MASDRITDLKRRGSALLIIHYSCEALNDGNDGYSPRITSIVAHNYNSNTSHSFSIHLEAEIQKIAKNDIEKHYGKLEKSILSDFFKFVAAHENYYWLHWNMRNINYGFEALAHRYKVLGAEDDDFSKIPDERRVNLSDEILKVYGYNSISNPRMQKLMELNGGEPKGFLSGENEAKAFKNKEYVLLHGSTLAKVRWFRFIFEQLLVKKIKTERSSWRIKVSNFCEGLWIKIVSAILSMIGLSTIIWNICRWLYKRVH